MSHLPFINEIENLLGQNQGQVVSMGEMGPLLVDLVKVPDAKSGEGGKILVTGGGGYIGSHAVKEFLKQGQVLVVDNFSTGHKKVLEGVEVAEGDLSDPKFLDGVFSKNNVAAVVHFAGYIRVEESVKEPEKYFKNNVANTLNLLNAMLKFGVKKLVYSSSAAVYGNPQSVPIKETDPCQPTNPYGESKLLVEKIVENYGKIHGLSAIALRYFNAAGASLDGSLGESHVVETHLIPKILDVVLRKEDAVKIFGNDYPTRDGTAV